MRRSVPGTGALGRSAGNSWSPAGSGCPRAARSAAAEGARGTRPSRGWSALRCKGQPLQSGVSGRAPALRSSPRLAVRSAEASSACSRWHPCVLVAQHSRPTAALAAHIASPSPHTLCRRFLHPNPAQCKHSALFLDPLAAPLDRGLHSSPAPSLLGPQTVKRPVPRIRMIAERPSSGVSTLQPRCR